MHRIPSNLRVALAALALAGCPDPAPSPPDVASLPPLPEAVKTAEAPRGVERPAREVVIALVGEVRGEIEPCGCPTLPYGGFARRGRALEALRAHSRPVLHLDAGELLLKGRATSRDEDADRRADLLLALSAEVGVDAWVPGPSDLLALGPEGLADLAAGRLEAPPAISATLETPDGALLLPPTRVVERGGVRVGVVGLSAEPQGRALRAHVVARPAAAAARAALATLPDDLDLVVGLGSLTDADADALAAEVPALDLMLTTRGNAVDAPRTPPGGDGPWVIESPDRGRYLQLVELRLGSDRGQRPVAQPDASDWRALQTAREQAASARAAGSDRLADREARLAELEAAFAEEGRGRNLMRVSARPLGEDLDPQGAAASDARPAGPTTLASRIAGFKAESLDQAAEVAAAPLPAGVDGYAASGGCVNCHAQEFARWSFSDHAKAWTSLLRKKEADNPECVGCHSTAFGQPGGFGELTEANVRKWKAVQCEACHGPMGAHLDQPSAGGGPVTEASCLGCHDEANSPDFEFETYLRRATCQEVAAAPAPPP